VFQRRSSASVDFYLGWLDYKNGFGNKNQDHWLGNKYIHSLSNQKTYELRIDVRDSASSSYYAVYSTFSINNEADKYRLSVGSHSGNTGYDALSGSNNKQFSTKDRDNDGWSSYDCAERHRGAWWFYDYYDCRRYYSVGNIILLLIVGLTVPVIVTFAIIFPMAATTARFALILISTETTTALLEERTCSGIVIV
ncbi:putative ficolin-2-like, partial [Apostichopus japonicus]